MIDEPAHSEDIDRPAAQQHPLTSPDDPIDWSPDAEGVRTGVDYPIPPIGQERLSESVEELRESLQRLLTALLDRVCGLAMDGVQRLADGLDQVAARGGVQPAALLGGLSAKLAGNNPLVGALASAFAAMSPGLKAAVVLLLVLAVVLLPVTVVLVLLALIVGAIVLWIRSAGS